MEWLHSFVRGDIISTVWNSVKEVLPKVTWFLPSLDPLMATVGLLLFGPCLFSLLVQYVSSRLQQFQVRLMMAQGIQLIPVASGPGSYRSLEQSLRNFYTSSTG